MSWIQHKIITYDRALVQVEGHDKKLWCPLECIPTCLSGCSRHATNFWVIYILEKSGNWCRSCASETICFSTCKALDLKLVFLMRKCYEAAPLKINPPQIREYLNYAKQILLAQIIDNENYQPA